jgi:hypothetical protein
MLFENCSLKRLVLLAPKGLIGAIVIGENAAGVIDQLPFYIRVALQEFFQVIMFGQIFFTVNQFWVAPQFGGYFRMITKKIVKLAIFVSHLVMIAPSRRRRGKKC